MGATYWLDVNESGVNAAFSKLEKRGSSVSTNIGKKFQESMNQSAKAVKPVGQALQSAGKQSNWLGETLQQGFFQGITGANNFAVAIANAIQAVGQLISSALELSSAFETGLAEISTLLDSHMMPQMAAFEQALIDISVTGDQSLSTLSRATYDAISAGITGFREQIEVVKEADIAATAGLTKTSVAMSAFVRLKNAFKDDAGTYKQINDMLFTTVKKGMTTFPEMAKAIGNVAGTAAQAGLSMKETLAAFAAITRVTKNSSTSMTYLRNLIIGIIKPSRQSRVAFEELGISYGQAALQSKGLVGVMQEVKDATGGSAEQIAKLFPSQRSMQAAMTLAGRGMENFRDSLEAMDKSAGASQEAYGKMSNTWTFETARFTNITSNLLMKVAGPIFDRLKESLTAFNSWFARNRETVEAWASLFGEVLGAVYQVVKGLIGGFWMLSKPITWLIEHNPFVWIFKRSNEYDKWFATRQKDIATVVDETKKLNEVTKQYALIQDQLVSGGAELNAAMERLSQKMRKLNTEQRAGLSIAIQYKMGALQKIIDLEERREFLFEKGRFKEIEAFSKTLAMLKEKENRTGYSLELLKKELAGGEKIIAMIKKKSERLTQAGLAGIAAQRFIVRGYDEERKINLARQRDMNKIYALQSKDVLKFRQAQAGIQAYWDKRLADLRAKNAKKGDRSERQDSKEPQIAKVVSEYAKQRAALQKIEEREEKQLDKIVEGTLGKLQVAAGKATQKRAEGIGKAMIENEKALNQLVQVKAGAGKDQGGFFDIVFGSDEQLQQRFGKMLETLGIGVGHLRAKILEAHSPDIISSVSAWWGMLTNTGRQGAESMSKAIKDTMNLLISSLSSAWVDLWAGMVDGTKKSKEPMAAAVWDVVSQIATIWMGLFLAMVPGLIAMKDYVGAALALVGALAMGILAGAAKGAAANARESSGGTASLANARASGGGAGVDNTRTDSAKSQAQEINIYYGTAYPANRQQIEEFAAHTADALNSSRNNNVRLDKGLIEGMGSGG